MSILQITVRAAGLRDIPAIVAIERKASTAASHWTPAQYQTLVENGVFLVAEKSDQLCGFICSTKQTADWEIENVVVLAEVHRNGVASELVRALVKRAKDENASAILLEVRESNLPAVKLYEKWGFQRVGRRPMYYKGPLEDALLYALNLGSQP